MPIATRNPIFDQEAHELPPDVERDFHRVGEIWKKNLKEFDLFIEVIQKRKAIEEEYVAKLNELKSQIGEKSSPYSETSTGTAWNSFEKSLKEECHHHEGVATFIENSLVSSLMKESHFQHQIVAIINRDVGKSFHDYNFKKSLMIAAKKSYLGEPSTRYETHMLPKEADYRRKLGHFERRRLRQFKLMEGAFIRMSELEDRRLRFVYSGVYQLYHHLADSSGDWKQHLKEALLDPFPYNQDIDRFVDNEIDNWKDIYSFPGQLPFQDKISGEFLSCSTFGVDLLDHLVITKKQRPHLLERAFEFIERRCVDASDAKKLYLNLEDDGDGQEVPLSWDIVMTWANDYEKDSQKFPWTSVDVRVLAKLAQKYLQELPEPIFPFVLHEQLRQIACISGEQARVDKLHVLLRDLPEGHIRTLYLVLGHLKKLIDRTKNANLTNYFAQIFIPYLIQPHAPYEHVPVLQGFSQRPYAKTFGFIIVSDLLRNCDRLLGPPPGTSRCE